MVGMYARGDIRQEGRKAGGALWRLPSRIDCHLIVSLHNHTKTTVSVRAKMTRSDTADRETRAPTIRTTKSVT